MMWLIKGAFSLLTGGGLSKILKSVDQAGINEVEKERVRGSIIEEAARQQTQQLNGPGKWLHALFIVPLGLWFTAVVVYSMLWCRDCMYPQAWSIAALPPPLDQWSGWIICSLFGYGAVLQGAKIVSRR